MSKRESGVARTRRMVLEQEGKLTKPAMVGGTIFGVGVEERLVIERAQREYEYHEAEKGAAPWEKNRVREFVDKAEGDATGNATPVGTDK